MIETTDGKLPLDCLLIHVPRMLVRDPLAGKHARITFLAAGLLSLAEALTAAGRRCQIVHLGVEKMLSPRFSLSAWGLAAGVRVAAFSLHWHGQTYDVLEAARQFKTAAPGAFVVLGGYTAGYFAREILRDCPFVDGVIRGEGEEPLVKLVDGVLEGVSSFDSIPNLVWRRSPGDLTENPVCYVASAAELDRWPFAAVDRIRHWPEYLRLKWVLPWERGLRRLHRLLPRLREPAFFGVPAGRGCAGCCTWCAGSAPSVRRATGRAAVDRRSPAAVAGTVARLREAFGVCRFYFCYDPQPADEEPTGALFEALGALRPRVRVDFECFGLPSPGLIRQFRRCLHWESRLILSPETADESLRRRHRAFPFDNARLEQTLGLLDDLRAPTALYFAVGLAGETAAGLHATREYLRGLRRRYACLGRIHVFPLEMEPGAPWFEDPAAFGIRSHRRTLADFRAASMAETLSLGYDTSALAESELLRLHRRLFGPAPAATGAVRLLGRVLGMLPGGGPITPGRWLRRH